MTIIDQAAFDLCICPDGLAASIDAGIPLHTGECWMNLLRQAMEADE